MGCYDSVWAHCPDCGTKNEFQSKGGECRMRDYTLGAEEIPPDVLSDVNRHSPCECYNCGCAFQVEVEAVGRVVRAEAATAVKNVPIFLSHEAATGGGLPVGRMSIEENKLPKDPNFCFSIAYRGGTPTNHPLEVLYVVIAKDEDYRKFLNSEQSQTR